jgi:hypothetical protein
VAQQRQVAQQRADHRPLRSNGTVPTLMTSNSRTAGCGPACPVVWQGRSHNDCALCRLKSEGRI